MQKLGMEHGEAIEHRWVTKAIENAQRKVEAFNFDIRKQLLEYDDVANDQRREIYTLRSELMETDDVSEQIEALRSDVVNEVIDAFIPPESLDELWDVPGTGGGARERVRGEAPGGEVARGGRRAARGAVCARASSRAIVERYKTKEAFAGSRVMRHFEKAVTLQILDQCWKEHLASMDYLRQGIGLRGYAQKNPKQEYKREAFEMFQALTGRIKSEVIGLLSKVQVRAEEDVEAIEERRRRRAPVEAVHAALAESARRCRRRAAVGGGRRSARPGARGHAAPVGPAGWSAADAGRRRRDGAGVSRGIRTGSGPPGRQPGARPAPGRGRCRIRRAGLRSFAEAARSGATSPVRAARERSTSNVTAG